MFKRIFAFLRAYPTLLFNTKTPAHVKYLPWVALAYLFMPIDVIPDMLPVLGQIDDIGVIIVLLSIATRAFERTPEQRKKQKYGDVIDVEAVKKP